MHYRLAWLVLPLLFLLVFAGTGCKKGNDRDSCPSDVVLRGKITRNSDGSITYRTSGGGTLLVKNDYNGLKIFHDDYAGFSVELWGGEGMVDGKWENSCNHENLNGKHIKDRVGNVRSFVFPDGAKMTIVASGEYLPVINISIYEGGEYHRISANCFYISASTINDPVLAKQQDDGEPDGEASTIEFTTDGLHWLNIYREDTPGNRINARELLGELFRNNPNQVNDYFDDPRLAHT